MILELEQKDAACDASRPRSFSTDASFSLLTLSPVSYIIMENITVHSGKWGTDIWQT